jgi:hypothetical protein
MGIFLATINLVICIPITLKEQTKPNNAAETEANQSQLIFKIFKN